jgi:hypothetical protein
MMDKIIPGKIFKITRKEANNALLRSKINLALIWLYEAEESGVDDPAMHRAIKELQDAIRSTEDENHGQAQQ